MKTKIPITISIFFIIILFPYLSYAIMGDADGNGVVDMEDARIVAQFVANQIPVIPNPADADANQDGKIDIEDAFIIAKKVSGQTRIVVVAPRYGGTDKLQVGDVVRIEVFEKFFPFNISGGTVRIRSVSTGYDSGDQPLTFERDGRSLYYHWTTGGLQPVSDYNITITILGKNDLPLQAAKVSGMAAQASAPADEVTSLSNKIFEPPFLAASVDAFCPAPGIPLEFRRLVPHDSAHYPYLGSLGRGWVHNFDIILEEYTDGRVAFHGPEGFNRFFTSNADSTYQSTLGDHGVLTRNPDGTFQLKEKNGFIYRFRSDLRLDYEQDLNGNRITAVYNGAKQLIQIQHSSGNSFSLSYNTAGRLISLTDHAGRVTTYEYDFWNLTLKKVTDPAGNVTEYTSIMGTPYIFTRQLICVGTCLPNLLDYRLQSITYPDGTRVQNEFDSQARLTRQTGVWGANPITYSYDADGTTHITDALGGSTTIKVNDKSQPLQVTTPDGAQTTFQYDTSANLSQVTDPLSHVTQFSYDGVGNITQVANPLNQAVQFGYDSRFNKPSSITNPLGKTTSFAYDSKGNLRSTTYTDGSSEGYDYDSAGNLISNTDATGKMTRYFYNTQGQMTTLKNAIDNSTQFSYDTAGDLQNVTDAKGHVVSHTRNTLGRLTGRTYPDGSHDDYEYDAAGKVTAFTNRRGERIAFTYDVTGRLEWKSYPSGKKLHFLYDGAGYLASVEQIVGATTTLDTAYERDALHRITKAKVPGKAYPESYDVSYAYDVAGNRMFMSYPDGYGLNYSYDAANRLIRISDASDNTMVVYEYDAAGRRTKKTLGNGTYTTYQYDDLDRLTLLVNKAAGGAVQSQFSYTYNAAGMRTSMTTLEGAHNYTYDNTYQLRSVSYPDGRTVGYDFDAVGNHKSSTDNGALTLYSANTLDQYTQAGAETFGYDTNGNLTTRTLNSATTTYGWDEDDRLISVDRNGTHIDYRYDYQGRLVAKTIGGQVTRDVWDGINLVAEMDSSGTVAKRYVFGASIDDVIVVTINSSNYWVQLDSLGSAVGITDNGGTVVGTGSYDIYGNPRSGTLRRFAGMRWDEDAGLYYVRARWYEPLIGRFITYDPMFLLDGLSRYAYVGNNPVNFVDLLGYERIWWNTFWNEFANGASATAIGELEGIVGGFTSGVTFGSGKFNADFNALYAGNCLSCNQSYWEGLAAGNFAGGIFSHIFGEGLIEGLTNWAKLNQMARLPNSFNDLIKFGKDRLQEMKSIKELKAFLDIAEINQLIQEVLDGQSGGACPTFIQGGKFFNEKHHKTNKALIANIEVPWPDSLLRSDIPIYGVASGKNFSSYRVEYGEGTNPTLWHFIEESDKSQEKAPDFRDISWMQGDLDLKGNLATWNTGLKNWVHLPWHPQEDATDLNGVYTLRLTVFGKNGEKAEDKITVEVGRAIAQSLPGIAISPDKRVVMRFPEQALTHPFRVYTILPFSEIGEETSTLCKGCEIIGQVYKVREPGDRFIKDVSLEFSVDTEEIKKQKAENIGIGRYDVEKNKWVLLETAYDSKSSVFKTNLQELLSPKAIYALIHNQAEKLSNIAFAPKEKLATLKPVRPGVLLENNFENGLGTFKNRDRLVGAVLSRDNTATPDGSYALKLTNENFGGNFSSTIIDQPFDVREYGTMAFDYRIVPGAKIDFFLKVSSRWYSLRFTGDTVDYKYRDVNIANMGAIQGIIADDKWHTATIDLKYLLRQQTRHTRIDEIIMANWNVGGYMKLEFGRNPRGSALYLDNFKITGTGTIEQTEPVMLVDNFNEAKSMNMLGGPTGTFGTPGSNSFEASIVDVPTYIAGVGKSTVGVNRGLLLTFDTTQKDSYGGYWTSINNTDLSDYSVVAFKVQSGEKISSIAVGIRNVHGVEGRTSISPYVSSPDANGWSNVRIPLSGLRGLSDASSTEVLFFSVSNKDESGKGKILIDDLRFEKQSFERVADFEFNSDWTLSGGDYSIHENGAAAISAKQMKDGLTNEASENTVMRIAYGGSIGKDYGSNGGFSYASWRAGLNGIDVRSFKYLVMKIRGENGNETPNIYITDPARRIPVRAKEIPVITKEWQTIQIPLDHYAKQGIDLSHLDLLEIVFEWEKQSGTIYLDDIRFE